MEKEKIREIAETENWRQKRKMASAVLLVSVAVFLSAVMFYSPGKVGKAHTSTQDESELTAYQQTYVDCPGQYRPLCTKMSKIPTEPVKFQKVEDGQLFLELPRSGRTLIARVKDGGKDGYLVRIQG